METKARSNKGLIAAAAAVLALLMVFFATVSVVLLVKVNRMDQRFAEMSTQFGMTEEVGETRENDVQIASEYWIRSTTEISDAYKRGSDAGLSADEKETLQLASAVLDEVITDGMTNYEKEQAVFDWMVSHLGFDDGSLTVVSTTTQDQAEPHGVLKYHTAVCVGYATTFRLFMEMLDIPCKVVHNTERYHSWDLVQLDEDWYHVDVYSAINGGGYTCLNQNDMMRYQSENWDTSFFPEANSLKYNYSYLNSTRLHSAYDLPMALKNAFADGGTTWAFTVECPDGEDYLTLQEMTSAIEARSNMDSYDDQWEDGGAVSSSYLYFNLLDVEDNTYLVTVQYYGDEGDSEPVDGVDYDKIEQSITDAFGEGGISVRDYR